MADTTVTVVNSSVFIQNRETTLKAKGFSHLGSVRKTDKTMWNLDYDVNLDTIVMAKTDDSTEGAGPV